MQAHRDVFAFLDVDVSALLDLDLAAVLGLDVCAPFACSSNACSSTANLDLDKSEHTSAKKGMISLALLDLGVFALP